MNYYADAIEICSKDLDWKKIVIDIAKKHPKAVVDAVNGVHWTVEAKRLMGSGKKIAAIKHCRNVTGMGLVEAKDACDALS